MRQFGYKVGDAAKLLASQTKRSADFEARRIRSFSQHRIIPNTYYGEGNIKTAYLDKVGICVCRIFGVLADLGYDIHALKAASDHLRKPLLGYVVPDKITDATQLGRALEAIRAEEEVNFRLTRYYNPHTGEQSFGGYCSIVSEDGDHHRDSANSIVADGQAAAGKTVQAEVKIPLLTLLYPILVALDEREAEMN